MVFTQTEGYFPYKEDVPNHLFSDQTYIKFVTLKLYIRFHSNLFP